jgi:hypothetical protein
MRRGSMRERGPNTWQLRVYLGVDTRSGRQRYATRTVPRVASGGDPSARVAGRRVRRHLPGSGSVTRDLRRTGRAGTVAISPRRAGPNRTSAPATHEGDSWRPGRLRRSPDSTLPSTGPNRRRRGPARWSSPSVGSPPTSGRRRSIAGLACSMICPRTTSSTATPPKRASSVSLAIWPATGCTWLRSPSMGWWLTPPRPDPIRGRVRRGPRTPPSSCGRARQWSGPPARNDRGWCGCGGKYKKCCGRVPAASEDPQ